MQPTIEFWRVGRGPLVGVAPATGFDRLRGLVGRPCPGRARALLIPRCRRVHGCGMSYAIDVVFIDRDLRVTRVARLRPWRFARCRSAAHVLELRAGEASRLGLASGDRFEVQTPITEEVRPRERRRAATADRR